MDEVNLSSLNADLELGILTLKGAAAKRSPRKKKQKKVDVGCLVRH